MVQPPRAIKAATRRVRMYIRLRPRGEIYSPRPIPGPYHFCMPRGEITVKQGRREVSLTNLDKMFFPELGLTKGDLLDYYAKVSRWLLPHLRDRAMVMRRYPDG